MLAVPKTKVVRGYSFFRPVIWFTSSLEDDVDMYWARSGFLKPLTISADDCRRGHHTHARALMPPGWVGIYEYALWVDRTGKHDLSDLRSIQGLAFAISAADSQGGGSLLHAGGFVKQYQIEVDPSAQIQHSAG